MRTLLTLLLLVTSLYTSAQDVLDKIAIGTCSCIHGLDSITDTEERNMRMGVCMLQEAGPYSKELKKKYKFDLNRFDEQGEEFGRLVGMRMAAHCPDVLADIVAMSEAEEEAPELPPVNIKKVHGTVQETKPSTFLTIVVRVENGSTYEFLLLDHVQNAEQIYTDPAKAKGFVAEWAYEEREFFDPYSRTYRTQRVLRGIEP